MIVLIYLYTQVWDACSNACISFSPQDFSFNISLESFGSHDYDTSHVTFNDSDDVMGYVVENNVILRALSDQIDQLCDNVDVKRGTSVTTLVPTNDQVSIHPIYIYQSLIVSSLPFISMSIYRALYQIPGLN